MYRSTRLALVSILALGGVATGCDAGSLANLSDSGEARRGMEALMGALGSSNPTGSLRRGDAPDVPDLPDVPDGPDAPETPELEDVDNSHETEVDSSVACPGGGGMDITGRIVIDTEINLEDPENAGGGASTEFSLTIAFDGCEIDGVQLDGSLTWEQILDVESQGGDIEIDYAWSYQGRVDFSGEVEGSCEIDMSATATEDDYEDLGAHDYDGTMCGFAAEEVAEDADL